MRTRFDGVELLDVRGRARIGPGRVGAATAAAALLPRLALAVRARRPAVAHVMGSLRAITRDAAVLSLLHATRVPSIWHLHTADVNRALHGSAISRSSLLRCLRVATTLVVVSPTDAHLIEAAVGRRPLVLPNPVADQYLVPVSPRQHARAPRVLTVGWLDDNKRQSAIAAALAAAGPAAEEASYRVVGPLEAGGDEQLQLARAALGDRLDYRGTRRGDDMRAEYDSADLFVLFSRIEGLPLSVLEAMARELPVVSSDVGGLPGLLRDSGAGVTVGRNDEIALAAAIEDLLADPSRRVDMGRAGREYVVARHSPDAVASRLAEAYDATITAGVR